MGAKYVVNKTAAALVVGSDSMTITAPAGKSLKVSNITIFGGGTASAANEVQIMRTTGGATPVAITPQPIVVGSPAATFTAASGWTTQPTAGVVVDRIGVNSNGAVGQAAIGFGNEIEIPGGGQLSIRSASGTGQVAIRAMVEEIG